MTTSNPNVNYEIFVRNIVQAILCAQGLETIQVQHDAHIQGISRSHQVDVYWEYRLGGILHRVILNCKRYSSTVEVTDVLTLSGVLADLPGVRGAIITTIGFQRGAVEYARSHQIGLKIVREPLDVDWEGRLRQINMQTFIYEPELLECYVQLDREWVVSHLSDDPDSFTQSRAADSWEINSTRFGNGSVNGYNNPT